MTVTTGKAVAKDAHKADAKDRGPARDNRGPYRPFEWLSQKLIDDCIHQDCELEPISKSFEQHRNGGELDKPQEVGRIVFPADE